MMWHGDGWWALMWVLMSLFWLAVVLGVVWLIVSALGGRRDDRASDLLRERFAAGEIDRDEYEQRRRALASPPYWPIGIIAAALIGALVVVPLVAMAANGWDMDGWGMHRGRETADDAPVVGGMEETVIVEDFAFHPGNLEVPVGATVTWLNRDAAPHDAVERGRDWRTAVLARGERDSVTFDAPGEYEYYCSIHPSMRARLVVRGEALRQDAIVSGG